MAIEARYLAGHIDTSNWPQSLISIADAIGSEAALKLVDVLGGLRKTYVAKTYKPNHTWARVIGEEAYRLLCENFGGQLIDVPRDPFRPLKKRAIIELAESDSKLSCRAIALRVRCTESYAQHVLRSFYADTQLSLFPEVEKRIDQLDEAIEKAKAEKRRAMKGARK